MSDELAKPSPHDVMSLYVRERFGLHPNWQWCNAECGTNAPDCEVPPGMVRLKGAAYVAKKSGKGKGKPNYRKPVDGTQRTCFYLSRELADWRKAREQELGICNRCDGTGEVWLSSSDNGTEYGPCGRCAGSGRLIVATQQTVSAQ